MLNVINTQVDDQAAVAANAPTSSRLWADLFPIGLIEELSAHPFLVGCRAGTVPKMALRHFLVQHQYYSSHFTRYLCAMMASLPSSNDVRELCANLFEEMGLDAPGKVTHSELYRLTLAELGVQPDSEPQLPETRQLMDSMYRYCRSADPLEGLSALCMGAEAIVPILYRALIDGLAATGASESSLYYFYLHVEEDEGHAITMRQVIDRLLAPHAYRRRKVHAVAEDMVRQRMELLTAVLTMQEAS